MLATILRTPRGGEVKENMSITLRNREVTKPNYSEVFIS